MSSLWLKAGMFAQKRLTNSSDVLRYIPTSDRGKEMQIESEKIIGKKTLGVLWQTQTDNFTFDVNTRKLVEKNSKRNVLSIVA